MAHRARYRPLCRKEIAAQAPASPAQQSRNSKPLRTADGMTNDCLEVFGPRAAWVAKIDFMVQPNARHGAVCIESGKHGSSVKRTSGCMPLGRFASFGDIASQLFVLHIRRQFCDGLRLVIVRSAMHDLDTRPFGKANQTWNPFRVSSRRSFARLSQSRLLLGQLGTSPRERIGRHEVRLTNERNPRKRILIGNRGAVERAHTCPP